MLGAEILCKVLGYSANLRIVPNAGALSDAVSCTAAGFWLIGFRVTRQQGDRV